MGLFVSDLLLKGSEKRRAIRIDGRKWRHAGQRRLELALLGGVLQTDVVLSREIGFIQNHPAGEARERIDQLLDRYLLAAKAARKYEEATTRRRRQLARFGRWWRCIGTWTAFAFRLPEFSGLGDNQRVDRQFLGFTVEFELEPVFQQRLDHWKHGVERRIPVYLGLDIVSFLREPGRRS